jgi:hypothetical protein
MTLSTRGYSLGENAWSYEAHLTAALPGSIHKVREELRAVGILYFQRLILERYGQHIPLDKISGEFEREEQALAPSADIRIEPLEITYRGKVHQATRLPTVILPSDVVPYDPEYDLGQSDSEEDEEDLEEADFDEDDWEDNEVDEEDEDEDEEYDD